MILNSDPLPTLHKALVSVLFSALLVPTTPVFSEQEVAPSAAIPSPVSLGIESEELHSTVVLDDYQPARAEIQGRENISRENVVTEPLADTSVEVAAVAAAPTGEQPDINETGRPRMMLTATVTAYNTLAAQTDGSPCIAAKGDNICGRDDVVACPRWIPLGTKVTIQNKEYECLDRTAMKYNSRFDISFDKDYEGAIAFGKRTLPVTVWIEQ